jgi:hypothetical protein
MWVRQCDLDAQSENPLPIPARIASNEEFIPPPQTPEQKAYESCAQAISERAAKRQGLSRRNFLQIVRLRKLKMKPELMDKYKYADLTDAVKDQLLGLNAAKVFGVDPAAKRQAIKADKLTLLREEYRRNPSPSNTQFGWVWVDDGREPTVPVGT